MNEEKNSGTCGSRQNAKNMLEDKIKRNARYNFGLCVIRDFMPWERLGKIEEEAIWELFCTMK